MKHILLATLAFSAYAAHATTISATDPFNPTDSCSSAACDVIGDRSEFDIQSASVTLNPGSAQVDLYFNFGPGTTNLSPFQLDGVTLNVGDLFFTVGSAFEFAIPVVSHGTLLAGDLYQINNSSGLLTAQTVLGNPPDTYRPSTYVWAYDNGQGSVTNETTGTPEVIVSPNGDGVTEAKFKVEIDFTPSSQLLAASNEAGFGFQFEAATCANDVIDGAVSATPEPATLASMGAGLLLIGLFKRSRSKPRK